MHAPAPRPAAKKDTAKVILDSKATWKTTLQQDAGWPQEAKRPMLCIPVELTQSTGGALFEQVLPGLLTLPVELLIVGKGASTYGAMVTELAKTQKHRVLVMSADPEHLERMILASDMALFLSDPTGTRELKACLQAGTIPVALMTKELENYDPVQESGTSFLYEKENAWHCFAAVVRALETFVFPFDWRTIQKHCVGVEM